MNYTSASTTGGGVSGYHVSRKTYLQVRRIVKHIQLQHRRLRESYHAEEEAPSDGTAAERTDLLYSYLAEREAEFDDFLGRYSRKERDSILKTWVQYIDFSDFDRKVDEMVEAPPAEPREAMARVTELDQELCRLYERLEERARVRTVEEFFQELREITRQRARKNAEMTQQIEDL